MPKFMQSLGSDTYKRLAIEAKARDVTIQSLIRTIIVPDWLKATPNGQPGLLTPARPSVQTATLLSRTGILADGTSRPFLKTTLGRGKP